MSKFLAAMAALGLSFALLPSDAFASDTTVVTEKLSAPAATVIVDRRKPRVPGGSGCDDPEDIIEHPECTPEL